MNINNIYYTNLYDLITNNSEKIELVKTKYINLLSMLTITSDLDNNNFINILDKINKNSLIYIACINDINDIENFEIIGSGTILIEHKFIRGGMNVGHIEDIVVHSSYRKMGISQTILDKLKEFAKNNNCYKIILDCKESISSVYKKNNFEITGLQMSHYF
jgi:glucosamine-phosphate N-acetyltransferase